MLMVLYDNKSQAGIELVCKKPIYRSWRKQNGKSNLFFGQLLKYQKRNVKKVELSVLLSWLLESKAFLRNSHRSAGCLPGKRFPSLSWEPSRSGHCLVQQQAPASYWQLYWRYFTGAFKCRPWCILLNNHE